MWIHSMFPGADTKFSLVTCQYSAGIFNKHCVFQYVLLLILQTKNRVKFEYLNNLEKRILQK